MNSKIMLSLATVALFAATASADTTTYEGVETNAWFTATSDTTGENGYWDWLDSSAAGTTNWNGTTTVEIDTTTENPLMFANTSISTGSISVDGYRVGAQVTFVRSTGITEGAAVSLSGVGALGALAVTEENWYGVTNGAWAVLSGKDVPTDDTTPYDVTIDFKTNGVMQYVRYAVDGTVLKCNDQSWLPSGTINVGTKRIKFTCVALGGYGTVANLKGETTSYIEFAVDNLALEAAGIDTTDKTTEAIAAELNTKGENKMYKWQSVMLGLNSAQPAAQPYAAPVQNAYADKLEFALGGVNIPASVDKSKIEYGIEVAETPDGFGDSASYYNANTTPTIKVDVPNTGVKYYRIKVRINR